MTPLNVYTSKVKSMESHNGCPCSKGANHSGRVVVASSILVASTINIKKEPQHKVEGGLANN